MLPKKKRCSVQRRPLRWRPKRPQRRHCTRCTSRWCRNSLLYKGSEDDNELGLEVTGCAWNKRTRTKTMMTAMRIRVKGSMVAVRLRLWGVDKRTV
jgi:hypothetical protein